MKDLSAQFYTFIPQLLLGDHLISHLLQEMSPHSVKKYKKLHQMYLQTLWRRSGLMGSAFVPGSSGPGLSPGQGDCIMFLGNTLYSHSDPGV